MAIQSFKDIIENKGYRISGNDRALFELGDIQSFFGFSENDCIEFILYDINDNQLPQTKFGLVRYLPLTNENIKDYFLIAEGTVFQKYKFPSEYFIDAERLIKEAGYNSGIFKVQITLINKRVGGNEDNNKLWISEISPSRLEIRLFPVENKNVYISKLKERYNIFVQGKDFREDTLRYAISAIESINPNYIASALKTNYSEQWFNTFLSEYKIQGFDIFCTKIYNKFVEACLYEFTNRNSNIDDLNYGKPKIVAESTGLSKDDIIKICEKILIQVLNKNLINPNIRFGSTLSETLESYDAVEQVLQSKTSDLTIETPTPIIREAVKAKIGILDRATDVVKEEIREKTGLFPKKITLPIDVPIDVPIDKPNVEETVEPFLKRANKKKGLKGKIKEKLDKASKERLKDTFEKVGLFKKKKRNKNAPSKKDGENLVKKGVLSRGRDMNNDIENYDEQNIM